MSEMKIEKFYNDNYKKLLIIPLILIIFTIGTLSVQFATSGEIINKDITLKGGISATIYSPEQINMEELESHLITTFESSDLTVRELKSLTDKENVGIIIEGTDLTNEDLQPALEEYLGFTLNSNIYSVQEMGSTLGESFFREMILAILTAFILMAVVVLVLFRKFIPSMAVVLSALLDLGATLAVVSITGMKLSTAGIAAFLMVIGYSIDTDILLTTRMLKRKNGTLFSRTYGAFKTGITMTLTTLIALGVAFFVSNSPVLKQMFGIILIALMIDILATWTMNAPILTWYAKKNGN
jgi:preprotein translocase subunit SecF